LVASGSWLLSVITPVFFFCTSSVGVLHALVNRTRNESVHELSRPEGAAVHAGTAAEAAAGGGAGWVKQTQRAVQQEASLEDCGHFSSALLAGTYPRS